MNVSNNSPLAILHQYWGYPDFRGSQETIINKVLDHRDVLGLLPTGGGKSLCFQVPALLLPGICIVVSPLIALIQNQVQQLQQLGIKAIGLSGGIAYDQLDKLLDNCIYGNYKFLYLSPERLQQELVQQRLEQMNVNLLVIDEAHCISQWGHDFRPVYRHCNVLRTIHPDVPMIALTATATTKVVDDIICSLGLVDPYVATDSFNRKNIAYKVLHNEDKIFELKHLCSGLNSSGIVYVRTRRLCEELAAVLNASGFKATFYHGGLSGHEKTDRLEAWMTDKVNIVVATNAFGMGIDKANVGLVVHYQIPDCIENYFQESGRAGRNGQLADAVLLTNHADEAQLKKQFLSVLPDVDFIRVLYRKLCNYFQVAYGEGSGQQFSLNFNLFCATYKLNTLLTFNTLQLLDRNSVIALSESFSKKTLVFFKVGKAQIFEYLLHNPTLEIFVKTLLRTYGGIFEYEIPINTVLIAKKMGIKEWQAIAYLEQLGKDDIIELKLASNDLSITFLVPREDDLTINVFAPYVRKQNELKQEKIQQILDYVANRTLCRSKQLLAYFGEALLVPCGKCDVCIQNNVTHDLVPQIKKEIVIHLSLQHASSRDLVCTINQEQRLVLNAIQELLEAEIISINAKNKYQLVKK